MRSVGRIGWTVVGETCLTGSTGKSGGIVFVVDMYATSGRQGGTKAAPGHKTRGVTRGGLAPPLMDPGVRPPSIDRDAGAFPQGQGILGYYLEGKWGSSG